MPARLQLLEFSRQRTGGGAIGPRGVVVAGVGSLTVPAGVVTQVPTLLGPLPDGIFGGCLSSGAPKAGSAPGGGAFGRTGSAIIPFLPPIWIALSSRLCPFPAGPLYRSTFSFRFAARSLCNATCSSDVKIQLASLDEQSRSHPAGESVPPIEPTGVFVSAHLLSQSDRLIWQSPILCADTVLVVVVASAATSTSAAAPPPKVRLRDLPIDTPRSVEERRPPFRADSMEEA